MFLDEHHKREILIGEIILKESCLSEGEIKPSDKDFTFSKSNKIYVYSDDNGAIPHIHLKNDNKRDSCIKLIKNEYFIHGDHKRTLNSKERKLFNEFMNQPSNYGTKWDECVYYWNDNKERLIKVPDDTKQPDYTTINKEKGKK